MLISTSLPTHVSERLKEPFGKLLTVEVFGKAVNSIAAKCDHSVQMLPVDHSFGEVYKPYIPPKPSKISEFWRLILPLQVAKTLGVNSDKVK